MTEKPHACPTCGDEHLSMKVRSLPPPAAPGLDVERLARALRRLPSSVMGSAITPHSHEAAEAIAAAYREEGQEAMRDVVTRYRDLGDALRSLREALREGKPE